MDVYAVVSISGDPFHKQNAKTPVDRDGGTNPTWNFPIKFTVNESLALQNRLTLEIKLRSKRSLTGDKDIGQVLVPVKEHVDQPGNGKSFQNVSYAVRKPSGKAKGALNLSYKFGNKVTAPSPATAMASKSKDERVMAYPPPPGGYPPPPPQHGAGYGYPPPPYGNPGYPPVHQPPKKNKFGMGLGAGLLGGMLIGDMMSDGSAYDAGDDDAGGFDFQKF